MLKVTVNRHIDAPPAVVWEVVNDLDRKHEYVSFVRDVFDVSDQPVAAGTTYRELAKFGPRETVSEWTFKEFDSPHRQVQEGRSPVMEATFTLELEPERGGTRTTPQMEVRLLPRMRPLGWLLEQTIVKYQMQADMERSVETLKRLVEREWTRRSQNRTPDQD